ncbi:MAG: hypothetical protein QOG20_6844 [Pseudonocardiales bacterium]|nr:hypothetical protein [Pseudonocardiales bacterium]
MHYREIHVPLTRAMPGLVEFTWGHGGVASAYVVARMTFADAVATDAAFASPKGRAAADDLANFAGPACSWCTSRANLRRRPV